MFTFLRKAPAAPAPTIAEVAAKVAAKEMILIDVRELAEVRASGKAKGAEVIPLSVVGLKCDPAQPDCLIPRGKPVAVYCASGGRSGMAAATLSRLGYGEVYNLGGLGDWVAGGGQVEKA
ncbi:MAG: rhodanese-like domain-containing protein [Cypionkella sp.]|jgi:rhodanese-related sulfurtransferase|nr:rhodanese-like domain-containing protein [Cypionkella sp.]